MIWFMFFIKFRNWIRYNLIERLYLLNFIHSFIFFLWLIRDCAFWDFFIIFFFCNSFITNLILWTIFCISMLTNYIFIIIIHLLYFIRIFNIMSICWLRLKISSCFSKIGSYFARYFCFNFLIFFCLLILIIYFFLHHIFNHFFLISDLLLFNLFNFPIFPILTYKYLWVTLNIIPHFRKVLV